MSFYLKLLNIFNLLYHFMFSWIFTNEKKETGPKPPRDKADQIPADDMWIYDYLCQYLQSPLWSIPLIDFVESNCIYFDEEEENKFSYTKIFDSFRELVASMVDSMMQQVGVNQELLQKCIKRGLRSRNRKYFEQLLVCDNFLAFKQIMIQKNKELEMEAIKEIQLEDQNFGKEEQAYDELELERLELEKAIAISLAVSGKIDQEQEKMIQQAIRQSQIEEQKRLQQQLKNIKISEPKKHLSDLPPLITSIKQQPIQQLKKQSEQIEVQLNVQRQKLVKQEKKEAEDSEERKKRLVEQRQLLRKKKEAQRQNQLMQFVQGKQQTTTTQKISQQELERRKNLMKKLKQQLE